MEKKDPGVYQKEGGSVVAHQGWSGEIGGADGFRHLFKPGKGALKRMGGILLEAEAFGGQD